MSITSQYKITPILTEDIEYSEDFLSEVSEESPGQIQILDLVLGNNTITVPTGGSSVAVAVIIIPPINNEETLTLKGVNGDTGVSLHPTNPSCISLNSVSSFVLSAGDAISGIRLIYV